MDVRGDILGPKHDTTSRTLIYEEDLDKVWSVVAWKLIP